MRQKSVGHHSGQEKSYDNVVTVCVIEQHIVSGRTHFNVVSLVFSFYFRVTQQKRLMSRNKTMQTSSGVCSLDLLPLVNVFLSFYSPI